MRLILSSNDFSRPDTKQCILDHLNVPLRNCRLLYIPNEKASEKQMRSDRFQNRCAAYGFDPAKVTVLNYYHAEEYLHLEIDAVYVSGGNTFSTYARICGHGFANALKSYILGGAVYIGGSCGAHIVSQDIRHVKAFDEDRTGRTDYAGLGLFPGILVCHYSEERRAVYEQLCRESPYPVYALRNGDSIVYEDGKTELFPADGEDDCGSGKA